MLNAYSDVKLSAAFVVMRASIFLHHYHYRTCISVTFSSAKIVFVFVIVIISKLTSTCPFVTRFAGETKMSGGGECPRVKRHPPCSLGVDQINPLKGRAVKCYTVPSRSNLPFLISDIRAHWRSGLSARVPECQKLKMVS